MRSSVFLPIFALLLSCSSVAISSQGGVGVPFLLITSSADGNAWGGVGTAVVLDDPLATLANPARLGMPGVDDYFAASTYTSNIKQLSIFPFSDVSYDACGLNAGFTLESSLPGGIRFGVGYSRVHLNVRNFTYFNTDINGNLIGRFDALQTSDAFSVGIGTTYYARVGVGLNFKRVNSQFTVLSDQSNPSAFEVGASAFDFGLLLQIPVFDIIEKFNGKPMILPGKVQPLTVLTFGYARSNMGGDIGFGDGPLPLKGSLGMSIELGITTKLRETRWRLFSITLAREAGDLLVQEIAEDDILHKPGIAGSASFIDNVLLGKEGDNFELRKGWQINLGEVFMLRGGSYTWTGNPLNVKHSYATSGFGVRLAGALKLVAAVTSSSIESPVLTFVMNHLDIRYDHSQESGFPGEKDTKYNSLSMAIR